MPTPPSHKNTNLTKVGGKSVLHSPWPRPFVTVDLAIFTVIDTDLKILLIRRGEAPYKGTWALPGGFVRVGEGMDQGEDLHEAAARELREETGLGEGTVFLEQIRAFGTPNRDPRGRVITIAYAALVASERAGAINPGTDAVEVRWTSLNERPHLAFDHEDILDEAVGWLKDRLDRSKLAFNLVSPTFTVAELRSVYEAILGTSYDAANFRRRFNRMLEDGLIEQAPGRRPTRSKPAAVYRFRA